MALTLPYQYAPCQLQARMMDTRPRLSALSPPSFCTLTPSFCTFTPVFLREVAESIDSSTVVETMDPATSRRVTGWGCAGRRGVLAHDLGK